MGTGIFSVLCLVGREWEALCVEGDRREVCLLMGWGMEMGMRTRTRNRLVIVIDRQTGKRTMPASLELEDEKHRPRAVSFYAPYNLLSDLATINANRS